MVPINLLPVNIPKSEAVYSDITLESALPNDYLTLETLKVLFRSIDADFILYIIYSVKVT